MSIAIFYMFNLVWFAALMAAREVNAGQKRVIDLSIERISHLENVLAAKDRVNRLQSESLAAKDGIIEVFKKGNTVLNDTLEMKNKTISILKESLKQRDLN